MIEQSPSGYKLFEATKMYAVITYENDNREIEFVTPYLSVAAKRLVEMAKTQFVYIEEIPVKLR